MSDEILALYSYNEWANERLLGSLRELTRGGHGSLNDARMSHKWKPL